jgi:hypothetical protein
MRLGSSQRPLKRTLRGSQPIRPARLWPRQGAVSENAFTWNGEYSVAKMHLRRREGHGYKRLATLPQTPWLVPFALSLQICIKCRSFKFSEKMQLIRVE